MWSSRRLRLPHDPRTLALGQRGHDGKTAHGIETLPPQRVSLTTTDSLGRWPPTARAHQRRTSADSVLQERRPDEQEWPCCSADLKRRRKETTHETVPSRHLHSTGSLPSTAMDTGVSDGADKQGRCYHASVLREKGTRTFEKLGG